MNFPGSAPLIINLAPTGAVADAARNPQVPVSEEAILRDVAACAKLGATVVHLHVRDEAGRPSSEPHRFGALIRRIRAEPGCRDLLICVTTSGRQGQTDAQRAQVLELEGEAKPDLASLTLGSLNFKDTASLNSPGTIRLLAKRMLERGIKPELEIFDLGMIHFAKVLIREGLLPPPHYFNLILGNLDGAQLDISDVAALIRQLPEPAVWSLGGIGRVQRPAAGLGCLLADGVRIGLEDNLWQDAATRQPWSNPGMVGWLSDLARVYGRRIATAEEVRGFLSLAG